MKDFYVYVYLNPLKPGNFIYGNFTFAHEPFYVGKGALDRIDFHMYEAEHKQNKHSYKVHTIRQIKPI